MAIRRGAFLGGVAALGAARAASGAGFGRALIVANLAAECDALEAACTYTRRRPLPVRFERTNGIRGMRGQFASANGAVEIWCIQDLVPAGLDFRSSAVKARALPAVVGGDTIALVGAFGTAATATAETQNGDVIVGTNTFVHDPRVARTTSHWIPAHADTLVTSTLSDATFRDVIGSPAERMAVEPSLLTTPLAPARRPAVIADRAFVALAGINVTHAQDYAAADAAVLRAYRASGSTAPIGCLETTNAVIRASTNAPFFFVSGITNRVGAFESEVMPRSDAQIFVAAFNAGLTVAAMAIRMLYVLAH